MIISLDISTRLIGIAVFEEGKLVCSDYIDLRKWDKQNLIIRFQEFKRLFFSKKYFDLNNIEAVVVEEAVKKFSSGKSSANTIGSLLSMNLIISNFMYEQTGVMPTYVTVAEVKKLCGLKIPKGTKREEKKKLVTSICEQRYPEVRFPRAHTGNYKQHCHDIADAIFLGQAFVNKSKLLGN